jgi:hypothetical protein
LEHTNLVYSGYELEKPDFGDKSTSRRQADHGRVGRKLELQITSNIKQRKGK